MFDQLRFDYLSCAGHPSLETPNIDWLAAKGVRFSNAYVQSPVCGASRMSFYTGRYVHSHGAAWNGFPLKVGEMTLGDHLRPLGMDCWLVGKTHMRADVDGMARLGLSPDSIIGCARCRVRIRCVRARDGLRAEGPDGLYDPRGAEAYNGLPSIQGLSVRKPLARFRQCGVDDDGEMASGWFMKNADKPANISEEDSETPYMTRRGMDFIAQAGDRPWLCHLSYIKPHWPYIVPAPYHAMYGHNQILPAKRSDKEKENPHPVYEAFMNNAIGQAFSRDEVRDKVVPAYMGLVKQCDDQMGVSVSLDGGDRAHGGHHDRPHLRPRRLSRRSLARREGSVSRSVGENPLIIYDPSDHADATPRHGLRCSGGEHRSCRHLHRGRRRRGA